MQIFFLQKIHLSLQWTDFHVIMFIFILNLYQSVIHLILFSQNIFVSFVNLLFAHIAHWAINSASRCFEFLELLLQWFIGLYYIINLF